MAKDQVTPRDPRDPYKPILPESEWNDNKPAPKKKYKTKHQKIVEKIHHKYGLKAQKTKERLDLFDLKLSEGVKTVTPKELRLGNIIKEILCKSDWQTRKQHAVLIAEALITQAEQGNMLAISEILNRVDGKVAERHQVESAPITLIFTPAEQPGEITSALTQRVEVISPSIEGQVRELDTKKETDNGTTSQTD